MQQQTSHTVSVDTLSRHNSLMLGDHKQVSVIFLKSTLTKKLQELFSIAFRRISVNNHSASNSKLRERHRDCMRSVNQSERKPQREKSQTERHSISSFQMTEDTMSFSEDVKTVLGEVYKCERLTQMVESAKRIQEVVGIESKRLEKLKNKERWREKLRIHDTELAAVCIEKLLGYVAELGIGGEEFLCMKIEMESLKEKLDQSSKPTKDKQSKLKSDENSLNKQNTRAIETLVTVMRDHKISNIKRKVEQESKKFTEVRKELFEGVLSSISKAEVLEQSNLSQITQLSSKLLEEQPNVQKNISYLEKQKRAVEKLLNQTKSEETKIAYYNIVDTCIYLIKLYTNLKEGGGGNQRPKSPSRVRKGPVNKTATKEKLPSKSKALDIQPIQPFKEDLTTSREEQSFKLDLSPLIINLTEMKQAVMREGPLPAQSLEKEENEQFKKILSLFCEVVEHERKQREDLRSFIQTLSFNIHNMRVREESLQQIIESKEYQLQHSGDLIEEVKQVLGIQGEGNNEILMRLSSCLSENKSNPEKERGEEVLTLLSSFFSCFSSPITSPAQIPSLPHQLIATLPQIVNITTLITTSIEERDIATKRYIEETRRSKELEMRVQESGKQVSNKSKEISYLKNTIEDISQQICHLRKQVADSNLREAEIGELRFEITLLKSENTDSAEKYQSTIEALRAKDSQSLDKIQSLQEQLEHQLSQSSFVLASCKEQHLNQKHSLEIYSAKQADKIQEILKKNTSLQSDIFLYKREIVSMKSHLENSRSEVSQEEVVNNLREENAMLREDVIEKGKMIIDFEVGQLSPRSMKSNVSGSLHSIIEVSEAGEEAFKKKNTASSSDMLREIRPLNEESVRQMDTRLVLEGEVKMLRERVAELMSQRAREERGASEMKKELQFQESQAKSKSLEMERMKKEIQEYRQSEAKLQERLKEYQIQEGSMIMKNTEKWGNQQQSYLDSLDSHSSNRKGSRSNLQDNASLLKKIDILQGQLYNQGSKLIKSNAMREQDLKILMSQNQLIQEEVRDINIKLASQRIKVVISARSLEDSMRKMEFQLNKLKHEGVLLKEELRNAGNLELSNIRPVETTPHVPKPTKSSYEFVTRRFSTANSNKPQPQQSTKYQPVTPPHHQQKLPSLPGSPRANKFEGQMKQMQKQKQILVSRVRLLSVFTIIDQQNKAFVHNINKIISSILEFLSTSQEFQQCDYTDVDYMSTLTQYLSQEDYQGYFQTLETFFKDLFLNVFERKNVEMVRQADQLMFLKDKMEILLSEKIDQIEEEEEKLSYHHRTPFSHYNEEKGGAGEGFRDSSRENSGRAWKRV